MKIPIQVAPVQRDGSTTRYATISGIKPSENLCSCHWVSGGCGVAWNHCPDGYRPVCSWRPFNCDCSCCNDGGCLGPFP